MDDKFDVMLITNKKKMVRCQSHKQLDFFRENMKEDEKIIDVKHFTKTSAPKDQLGIPIPPQKKLINKE